MTYVLGLNGKRSRSWDQKIVKISFGLLQLLPQLGLSKLSREWYCHLTLTFGLTLNTGRGGQVKYLHVFTL